MSRRVFAAFSLAFFLAAAVPAVAAPRRDSSSSLLQRIVQKLKQLVPLDANDPFPPKP